MLDPAPLNKKVQQSAATRAELLRVATDLFAERGYVGTALDEIAGKLGLTKGALYHHYRDKRALFDAVVVECLDRELERIASESRRLTSHTHENSWERLIAITELFLDGFLDPRLCRIVWVDGPAVLGWKRWHDVVSTPILDRIRFIAGLFAQSGVLEEGFQRPLAQLMFGAYQEAGLSIAHAEDPDAKRAEISPALRWMLQRLFRRSR